MNSKKTLAPIECLEIIKYIKIVEQNPGLKKIQGKTIPLGILKNKWKVNRKSNKKWKGKNKEISR